MYAQELITVGTRWLPIMKAYERGTAAYFATPPVNLIYAFNASLTTITKSSEVTLEERFRLHKEASHRVKSAAEELGLSQVSDPDNSANGMTAVSPFSSFSDLLT
jgi:alanine-glyoxylate transaminase/serine-glyoxylate transaminase/serine-pyruvate transaminase